MVVRRRPAARRQFHHWPDGTELTITKGTVAAMNSQGYVETKRHFGGMKFADPHPFTYPTFTVEPVDGRIMLEVVTPIGETTAN